MVVGASHLSVVPAFTPEQRQAARLIVAGAADGAEDCRQLLDMLGLLDDAQPVTLDHAELVELPAPPPPHPPAKPEGLLVWIRRLIRR